MAVATDWSKRVTKTAKNLPPRIILHAVEKLGKSSFSAQFPDVVFAMTPEETGLLTLIDAGQVKETPNVIVQSWDEMYGFLDYLISGQHQHKRLAIDTLNGMEKLCHWHVCQTEYNGDWGPRGFANYQQGYDRSLPEIRRYLAKLDELREKREFTIIQLAHTKIETFKNPEGADYDRYSPAVHRKTWELCHRWADIIMFGNFHTEVVTDATKSKGKGRGGQIRTLYTERTAAYDAGNRYSLPEEIEMGTSGAEAFANFAAAMKQARQPKPE